MSEKKIPDRQWAVLFLLAWAFLAAVLFTQSKKMNVISARGIASKKHSLPAQSRVDPLKSALPAEDVPRLVIEPLDSRFDGP